MGSALVIIWNDGRSLLSMSTKIVEKIDLCKKFQILQNVQ